MHLSAIFVYPVKSLAGIRVDAAELDARGLRHDRRWMVVDDAGRFLTQRKHPQMVRVRPSVAGGGLRLAAEGLEPLEVPPASAGGTMRVRVWSDECDALRLPSGVDEWLTAALGVRCHLVFMPSEVQRRMPGVTTDGPAPLVSFTDGYPLHLVGEGSLEALNRRLASPVGVERFRPNLVVAGAEAHAEDGWAEVEVGGVRLRTAAPCERCAVTTVDPADGTRGQEPLRTLAGYRNAGGSVTFGTYLAHAGRGTLRVGDAVSAV